MSQSYVQTDLSQTKASNRSVNYQYNNHFEMRLLKMDTVKDWMEWTYNLTGLYGGNSVVSTTRDMLKYDRALYNGILLSRKSLGEAFTPVKLNNGENNKAILGTSCGLGWFIFNDTTNGKIVWHSGANPGVTTLLARNITKRETYIVVQNISCPQNVYRGMLDIIIGKHIGYKRSIGFLYGQDLYSKGINYAISHLKVLQEDSLNYVLVESEVDRIGLEFSRTKSYRDLALEAYKINVLLFPDSWKAYYNYGISLSQKKENSGAAILMFQKALMLDPENKDCKSRLNQLL
jgi:tetratricopeptide (TPR) repeat protein